MKPMNECKLVFWSRSMNEGFARGALAAFLAQVDPTVVQLADLKTALSEAVTNCIVHAYPTQLGKIILELSWYEDRTVKIVVADSGKGIENIHQAMQPLFTTGNPDESAGLGFAVIKSFMDEVKVSSRLGHGTRVTMKKKLRSRE